MPRSRSTAFFRMMAERGDFTVVHEPFSNLAEFGHTTIDGCQVRSQPELLAAIRALAARSPVFFKDTTDERYEAVLADDAFLAADAVHTFLIRDPAEAIASYYALNPSVQCAQIGVESLHELYTAVCRRTGRRPVVIDATDLVDAPDRVVEAYCARAGIPHRPEALTWQPGDRPEWRPTARWHRDVGRSAGFRPTERAGRVDVASHPVLGAYERHHRPFYDALFAERLRPL
jgi:hypothetical protein